MLSKRCLIPILLLVTLVTGCASETSKPDSEYASRLMGTVPSISVMSDSVDSNGVLNRECCYTKAAPKGDNKSPHLAWNKVDGATAYAIYMYDRDADNYLHWRVVDVTGTTIPEGAMSIEPMYIGPFPPEGTHHYEMTVYALKELPEEYLGQLNENADIDKIETNLDVINGKPGNVIAVGVEECTVTRGK